MFTVWFKYILFYILYAVGLTQVLTLLVFIVKAFVEKYISRSID